ncbi:unnamed protein product [Parnassius apollo]|uniref:(apollo) hypothetical protein n=1 Tax=Parnassius apollo TaxID=110799 RepID=A0A8S3XSZ2_PARAO|nr:unnamed protein product [Parnassius apollo]
MKIVYLSKLSIGNINRRFNSQVCHQQQEPQRCTTLEHTVTQYTHPVRPPGSCDGALCAQAAARSVAAPGALRRHHQLLHARRPQRFQLPHLRTTILLTLLSRSLYNTCRLLFLI